MRSAFPSVLLVLLIVLNLHACSRQTAEEKGKALATEKIDLVKGVGDALNEKGKQAAESVAQGAGRVVQGVDEGFGKAFEWQLSNSASMEKAGLKVFRAEPGPESEHSVNAYIVASGAASGSLSMIAYDPVRREVARTRAGISMEAGSGRYETLFLDKRTPMRAIREIEFDFQPTAVAAN